jgi:hypothetical protein
VLRLCHLCCILQASPICANPRHTAVTWCGRGERCPMETDWFDSGELRVVHFIVQDSRILLAICSSKEKISFWQVGRLGCSIPLKVVNRLVISLLCFCADCEVRRPVMELHSENRF